MVACEPQATTGNASAVRRLTGWLNSPNLLNAFSIQSWAAWFYKKLLYVISVIIKYNEKLIDIPNYYMYVSVNHFNRHCFVKYE